MKTMMKRIFGSFAACFALCAAAEDPAVSGVMVRQRWPWSRLVDIDYVLTCDPGAKVDVTVGAYDGAAPLALPLSSFSGDLYGVDRGLRRIVWDPTVTAYTNNGALPQFRVALTPMPVPLYMIVDLTKSAGEEGQIEYVGEEALTNGLWGAWVRNPVTNNGEVIESVVWTGVATNDLYKTDRLVLRRVPAGSYTMGGQGYKGMYAGVFEVTQQQWSRIMNNASGTDRQAKHTVSYNDIRGATNSMPPIDWPATGRAVAPDSFLGKLRDKTGLADFDLPTEARWEYLCRAGTTTVFNDGNADAKYNITGDIEANNNGYTNKYLNALGWYKFNDPTPPSAAQPVGGKRPNAWGLYDTHGNLREWCLDWTPTDPERRVTRGGCWSDEAERCRSAFRDPVKPSSRYNFMGFRLVRPLP